MASCFLVLEVEESRGFSQADVRAFGFLPAEPPCPGAAFPFASPGAVAGRAIFFKSGKNLEEKNKSGEWEGQRGCDPWVLSPWGLQWGGQRLQAA